MEPDKAADLVRKLRAKAASTTFPEERKLLTAKADKLTRKYRVDERSHRRPAPRDLFASDHATAERAARYFANMRAARYAGVRWESTVDVAGPFQGAVGDMPGG